MTNNRTIIKISKKRGNLFTIVKKICDSLTKIQVMLLTIIWTAQILGYFIASGTILDKAISTIACFTISLCILVYLSIEKESN
jgi:hypothetical protein